MYVNEINHSEYERCRTTNRNEVDSSIANAKLARESETASVKGFMNELNERKNMKFRSRKAISLNVDDFESAGWMS